MACLGASISCKDLLVLHCIRNAILHPLLVKNYVFSPGWYSSVDWALVCELKCHWFDPQLGHMPGRQTRAPVGGCARGNLSVSLSLSFSVPSPLSKKKKRKLCFQFFPVISSLVFEHLFTMHLFSISQKIKKMNFAKVTTFHLDHYCPPDILCQFTFTWFLLPSL